MSSQESRTRRPRITGAHAVIPQPNVSVTGSDDEVRIIVTQLFGPKGDNLVGHSSVSFDGYPAFTLLVKADGREQEVHLSPIHGDTRKIGFEDLAPGTRCQLFCPISKEPLLKVDDVPDDQDTDYYALYLTPQLSNGSQVLISNVWGHYHSRVVDDFELISAWMPEGEGAEA